MIKWEEEAKYYFTKYHRDISMMFGQKLDWDKVDEMWKQEKEIIKEVYEEKY